ncbi:MAG: ParB/RepB/Spo0J family partition protein [Holosporales bacterium]|jgi:ParB family chromosome partitioning protein|nr:ParB/RepB/Spo0J family partition protein [Holosporales bacterium]
MEQKLGRGLSALLGEVGKSATEPNKTGAKMDINNIVPNEGQPRKFFDPQKLKELTDSISLHGMLQPIAIRQKGDKYEIVAGERRWRAAKMAGLTEIPVHVVECDDRDIMALALIENLQRTDLNPIEEAEAMRQLMDTCECRQEDVGVLLSKSRTYITNSMRLLSLPGKVQELIRTGRLSAGHARCLVGVQNAEEIADLTLREGWTVRQLEGAMKDLKVGVMGVGAKPAHTTSGTPIDLHQDPESMDLAIRVAEALAVETKLKVTKHGGVITLICKSCEELETLIEKLTSLEKKKT